MDTNENHDTKIEIPASIEKDDNEAPTPMKQVDHIPLHIDQKSQNDLINPTRQHGKIYPLFLETLIRYCMNWIKHPKNIALLLWLVFVAAGLLALFLLMTGLVDGAPSQNSQRERWTENVNQILNVLFTIMCLYEHPNLFHHLVLLCRWRVPADVAELRRAYCKNKAPCPHERTHLALVVALLHITCFSQYMLCGLFWGYTSKTRPNWVENLCIMLGIASPIIAYVYIVCGPLRLKSEPEPEPETCRTEEESTKPAGLTHVGSPEWAGGLSDFCDDINVAYLSFFCTFCVFGWNMERLGFGNMYVHITTFLLLVIAPFWVFNVSALKVNDHMLRDLMVITGIVLCFLGLLYGGFWRNQMRKRFRLPSDSFCGSSVADFMRWLFCWSCSLAQEVRTGNYYNIEEDGFYIIESEDQGDNNRQMQRECDMGLGTTPNFEPSGPDTDGEIFSSLGSACLSVTIDGETGRDREANLIMTPPLPSLIQTNKDVRS